MKRYVTLLLLLAIMLWPITSRAKVKVIASTSDLAHFAREVGGDRVMVSHIAPPKADVHFIEVRPSYMMKVARAEVALKVGLELDMWMDRIIDGSRNNRLLIVDCSKFIQPLEVPTFKADARYGDLHRFGNPHYWLSPQNVRPITDAIVEGFSAVDPEHSNEFIANQGRFLAELEKGLKPLRQRAEALRGKELVFYHNSWPYFNEFAGLTAAAFVEPYPGVPPSPSHVKELIELVRARDIKVIAVEPYFDKRVPNKIASVTGAQVVTLYPSVGGQSKGETYLEWLESNLNALLKVLK